MPVELALWRLDEKLTRVQPPRSTSRKAWRMRFFEDLSLVEPNLMFFGRQVVTSSGGRIDIVAIDAEGDLVVIELKRSKTARDVAAQLLDYAWWVRDLSYEDVVSLYEQSNPGQQLERDYASSFGASPPDELAQNHRLIIVCSQLDPSTERIIGYLNEDYGVPINAVFFRHFEDDGRRYLARTWLIDPSEAEAKATRKKRPAWNGRDFYASFGEGEARRWVDARRYGFIGGGGGKWYSQTLRSLEKGHRVFVHIPQRGYVGVGEVIDEAVPIKDFRVRTEGQDRPLLDLPLEAENMDRAQDDLDECEWVVAVNWLKAHPIEDAYWEKGLFASQHTACKLRHPFTIERLTDHFGLDS